ncbi:hypothetical protein VHEMI10424 [[Torrubiella] hemipterigena]|uniref:Uncharacterized protein n=1 Tax=[Torrubiella] hemipterigena TaxID=1531966 RepID=A0A0A1TT89_9HYPO|nr:hypothetical protein VHEMI10424 [[Torrubiella] hemipterigena]
MPGLRAPSPSGFRRRSVSLSGLSLGDKPVEAPNFNQIIFPRLYKEAWTEEVGMNDGDRARVYLLRMARMDPNPIIFEEVRSIVSDDRLRTIPCMAGAIKTRIYGNRHASFETTPFLQCVRYMLIRSHLGDKMVLERTREVMDFFFDPTLERNLKPPPQGEVLIEHYPAAKLKVCIVGGGPTALASAIALAEKGRGDVEVHMYEKRWIEKFDASGKRTVDYPANARRRDQVVTLQDSVTVLLSKPSYEALFAGRPERVWPGSANIQIRKVEDRFLKRVQAPEFNGLIHLHTGGMTREELCDAGDFHLLLGADGAASWVRQSYFQGYENERGRSYALGLAFDRPAGLPWSQPLNVFLTLGQTRYLLNASDHDGRGYLNMQLTEQEWHKMVALDGQPVHFGRPGCLRQADGTVPPGFTESNVFAPSEDRSSPMWTAISDGLKLFGFKEEEVINIVRIPIVVQAVREGVHILPAGETSKITRPHALVAVAGDAAMTVHFWPGRGLNSGIKAGLALGDELVHALNSGKFVGMPLEAMSEYNSFILKLQDREHDKRSIPILNQSGSPEMLGWLLEKAQSVPDTVAIEWLVGAMAQIADRLQRRDDWAYKIETNIEPQLRIVLRQLQSMTLKEMAVSFPWPTREMAGAEVLPLRSMKPEEKQKWLQSLWTTLRTEKKKDRRSIQPDPLSPPPTGRFEAPKGLAPPVNPAVNGIKRSNATQSVRHGRSALAVPGGENGGSRDRSPSPGPMPAEVTLTRMLTVHKRPPKAMLDDALSLALFRMQETN